MRKPATALAALLAITIIAGCAGVPQWVERGSIAAAGEEGNAIYAVEVAAPEADAQLQADIATMNARVVLVRMERDYVEGLLRQFVEDHKESFDEQYAASAKLYEEAAEKVIDATRLGMREVATWRDAKGIHGEKDLLYVQLVLPLDESFFDAAQQEYEAIIQAHKDKLLKGEPDAVLKALDEELKRIREDPFGKP